MCTPVKQLVLYIERSETLPTWKRTQEFRLGRNGCVGRWCVRSISSSKRQRGSAERGLPFLLREQGLIAITSWTRVDHSRQTDVAQGVCLRSASPSFLKADFGYPFTCLFRVNKFCPHSPLSTTSCNTPPISVKSILCPAFFSLRRILWQMLLTTWCPIFLFPFVLHFSRARISLPFSIQC